MFTDGTVRTVNLLLVLGSGGATAQRWPPLAQQAGCTPTELLPVFTLLQNQFRVPATWPISIETRVVDDCGDPLTTGSVVAEFSNEDPPLPLVSLRNGDWSGTWQARNARPGQVKITVTAEIPGTNVKRSAEVVGGLQSNPNPPQVGDGAVVSAASFAKQVPAAPGGLISIFGTNLAEGTAYPEGFLLPTQLAGATVVLAGKSLPLLYASAEQINAMIHYDTAVNTQHQLVVQRGSAPATRRGSLAGSGAAICASWEGWSETGGQPL